MRRAALLACRLASRHASQTVLAEASAVSLAETCSSTSATTVGAALARLGVDRAAWRLRQPRWFSSSVDVDKEVGQGVGSRRSRKLQAHRETRVPNRPHHVLHCITAWHARLLWMHSVWLRSRLLSCPPAQTGLRLPHAVVVCAVPSTPVAVCNMPRTRIPVFDLSPKRPSPTCPLGPHDRWTP